MLRRSPCSWAAPPCSLGARVRAAPPTDTRAPAQPARRRPPPGARRRPRRSAAARARRRPRPSSRRVRSVPGGAKIAFMSTCRSIASCRPREGRGDARPGAEAEESRTRSPRSQKPLQDDQQKLQTGGSVMNEQARGAAREGNRAADPGARAVPAGRAGRDQRAAARAAERVPEAALADPRPDRERERPAPPVQRRRVGASGACPGLDLTGEVVKKLDAAAAQACGRRPKSG